MPQLAYPVRAPLTLHLSDGERVEIAEWSLDGLTWPGETDILPRQAKLVIPFQGVDIRFAVQFGPVEGNWLQFKGLTGRERETLAVFYRSILSGKMASTDDMITSLDTPVDLVPLSETEEEIEAATQKTPPRVLRVIWNLVYYFVLAGVVFGVIGTQIWSRLDRIPVQNGRIDAPMQAHIAPEGAFVEAIAVSIGERVRRGQVLVELSDPERDGRIDDTRAEIRLAERRLNQAHTRLAAHLDRARRLETNSDPTFDRLALARLRIAITTGRPPPSLDDDLRTETFDNLRFDLEAVVTERALDLSRLKRELSNRKDAASALDIVAAADGHVREIAVIPDQFVQRGALAVVVEEDAPRHAVGWVDEGLAATLHIGMKATIVHSRLGERRHLPARLVEIEAGVDPARPDAFGLIVRLLPDGMDAAATREAFRPNAPLKIVVRRKWWSRLVGADPNA